MAGLMRREEVEKVRYRSWQFERPGEEIIYYVSQRHARKLARFASTHKPGRFIARRAGTQDLKGSTRPYLFVYEGGKLVEKGRDLTELRDMLADDLQRITP